MFEGHRVYDACDIPALVAFSDIPALLELAHRGRLDLQLAEIQTASDRHLYETGHRLAFGCCANPEPNPETKFRGTVA